MSLAEKEQIELNSLSRIMRHVAKFDYLFFSFRRATPSRGVVYACIGYMRPGRVGGNTACVLLCNETSCAMLPLCLCLEKILDMMKSRPLGALQEKEKKSAPAINVSVLRILLLSSNDPGLLCSRSGFYAFGCVHYGRYGYQN